MPTAPTGQAITGTFAVKVGLASDVEGRRDHGRGDAGAGASPKKPARAVSGAERVPADIRKDGGVAHERPGHDRARSPRR
ncbi:MAG: hypothetical protein R2838_14650 [Caldilineaceae bacterium]